MSADITEPILKVKLIRPPVRSLLVPRPRLLRRLDGVFSFPLTLVCAPAGYGKTTLLLDWVSTRSEPVAWLSLGSEENDAARFLNYLILALQNADPGLSQLARVAVNIPGTDIRGSWLRLLVNALSERTSPLVVVLDDYHQIESEEVHQALATLIDHLPPALRLVISSRVEPPVALARLRGRSQVLELRAPDLRFQPDENEAFLNQVMALGLSARECERLEAQTEGWVAGLQLAALSLLGGEKTIVQAPVHAGQHYIFDYLAEDVLHDQPAALQSFLLRTSILDELTGPLCDALAEPFPPYQTGSKCLDALEHANLFTQALDGEHRWYRYHALFAGFLRDRLRHTHPEMIPDLHRKAAGWLAQQGAYTAAYRHALAGNDVDLAVRMVEASAETLEKHGELSLLSRWIEALPEEAVRTHPRLNLSRAWIALGQLEVKKARAFLDLADQGRGTDENAVLRGEILAARAFGAALMDQPEETRVYTEQAVQLLPGEGHYLSGLLQLNVCFPIMMSGRIADAIQLLEDAVYSASRSNSPFVLLIALRVLGEAYLMTGRLSQAERVFRQALDLIEKQFGAHSPLRGMAWLGLGEICRQRGDFPAAARYLEEGIDMTMSWMSANAFDGFVWLANLKQSSGDPAGAQSVIRQARQFVDTHSNPMLDDWMIDITTARLDILQGYLDEALRWVRGTGLDVEGLSNLDDFYAGTPAYFREMALYQVARLFLVLGRREQVPGALERAANVLDRNLPVSEEHGTYANLMEGLILRAQVAHALGETQKAQDYLHRALDIGAPERPIRIFLDEGEALMSVLGERRARDLPASERAYLEELWAAWTKERGEAAVVTAPAEVEWVEPLSHREIEVLRWLAEGKSNQEIAAGLVLSLNTVKKHVSTIIGKLDAKNRTQAVLIARRRGLL